MKPWIFHVQVALACGPTAIALALRGTPYYIGMAVVSAVFFLALKQISTDLHRIFVQALVAREQGGAVASLTPRSTACRTVSACFARTGVAVMDHRFQRDDGPDRRSGAKRRKCARHHLGLRQRWIDLGGERKVILSEIENLQARDIVTADPDHPETARCPGPSSRWLTVAQSCCSRSITERRNAEAKISHLARTTNSPSFPTEVSFRDEIGRLLAVQNGRNSCRRSCSSTSTSSSRSTTRWVIPAAIGYCARSPAACAKCCGRRISLARFGGDRIRDVQQNIRSHEDAAGLAPHRRSPAGRRYKIDNHLVEIGASVGIAMTSPGVGADTF